MLRGSEFCSSGHRKSHGERLNRALHEMAAPEPAPAGMAGYMALWPTQERVCSVTLNRWQFGNGYPTLLRFEMAGAPEVDDSAEQDRVPPLCGRWMPSLQAEPVALFVHNSSAGNLRYAVGAPAFSVAAELTTQVPPPCGQWMAEPAAEPAARLVVPQAAPQIEASSACRAAAVQIPCLELAAELPVLEKPVNAPAPCETWMACLAAEPVAQFVAQSIAPNVSAYAAEAELHLPGLALSPALESTEMAAEAFMEAPLSQTLRLSQTWMRAAEAEPVFSYVRSSVVGEAAPVMAPRAAGLAVAIAKPHVPAIARWMAVPAAEPVMAGVWPCVADTPLDLLTANAESVVWNLGALVALAQTPANTQGQALAAWAQTSEPSPVESWLLVAAGTVRAIAVQPAVRFELASFALAACKPVPKLAGPVAGAPPMGVESILVASAAAVPAASAPVAQMQPFALAATTEQMAPGFENPGLSLAPSAPKLGGNAVVPRPISTIFVTSPQPEIRPLATAMPQAGIMAVEYHAQCLRGTPVCEVKPQTPRIAPAPPRFVVRPVFDRLDEELTRQKPTRKGPAFAEVFTMPEARKRTSPTLGHAGRAIAAALIVGAMWLGVSLARLSRPSVIARQDAFGGSSETAAAAHSLSAASRPAGEAPGRTQATGPVAWVRQTIANRAAYQAAENFHAGMQAWGSGPKSYAAGWERNREGYVHPGTMAIFNPSRNFKDYHFEFFGQLEQKGMGWVVRAKDTNNYYAMKFKVLEAGLRPIIAMVHYTMVDGKAGHRVETPLNVMVHNNRPFQVAVDVKGNHFSASIDGEEVDSWSDDVLPAGGVGFFAEAGERSRLYWMKISKNDDWLGGVCAMLAGSDAAPLVTSELWGAGSGNMPRGGIPASRPADSGDMTLAAAGLGLPFFRAQRTRNTKNRRHQPWS